MVLGYDSVINLVMLIVDVVTRTYANACQHGACSL
jgi:hypothetical protein